MGDSEPDEHPLVILAIGPVSLEHRQCIELGVVHLVALEGAAAGEERVATLSIPLILHGP